MSLWEPGHKFSLNYVLYFVFRLPLKLCMWCAKNIDTGLINPIAGIEYLMPLSYTISRFKIIYLEICIGNKI